MEVTECAFCEACITCGLGNMYLANTEMEKNIQ